MDGIAITQCPSCGGSSLGAVGDGAVLVCDDCHEQFQGYRQEEMDEEGAGNLAVFTRQSQEAQREVKLLNAAAADARASIRNTVKVSSPNRTFTLYKSVVVITRAIIDALVEQGHAPANIVDPCFQIVTYWIQISHSGSSGRVKGASPNSFSLHCILAFITLAAMYTRTPLLPRDICQLAANNQIPYVTAAVDLLDPETLNDKVLRSALTFRYIHTGVEVSRLACAIGTSEYAWPPLLEFFDGPRTIYTHEWHGDVLPLGHYDTTLTRVIRLLGLPEHYFDRVKRYRELHLISVSMARKTQSHFSEYSKRQAQGGNTVSAATDCDSNSNNLTNRGSSLAESNLNAANPPSLEELRDEDGTPDSSQAVFAQEHEDTYPESAVPESNPLDSTVVDDESYPTNSSSGSIAYDERGSWRDEMNSYPLRRGISSFPFTSQCTRKVYSLEEFPTPRTIIVDVINTMRVCFASAEYDENITRLQSSGRAETFVERCERESEWGSCFKRMHAIIKGDHEISEAQFWSGLSPPALASLRGKPLKQYVERSLAIIGGDVPIFMKDHESMFEQISRQSKTDASDHKTTEKRDIADKSLGDERNGCHNDRSETTNPNKRSYQRFGNWMWTDLSPNPDDKSTSRSHDIPVVTKTDMLDSLPGINRDVLLRIRGVVTNNMNSIGVNRGLRRKAWKGEEILTEEPAALGWAIYILQRFFCGTFAYIAGKACQDELLSRNLAHCCDISLKHVLNYIDIYLGEEGQLAEDVEGEKRSNSFPGRYGLSKFRQGHYEKRQYCDSDFQGHFHLRNREH